MKKNCITLLIISIFLFLIFISRNNLFGSRRTTDFHEIKISSPVLDKFQPADIVLRSGKGFISDMFRQFSLTDKQYSHAGIVIIENNKIYVYHILGGEMGNEGQLKKETFEKFCNPTDNSGFAVYRYDLQSTQKQNMVQKLYALYQAKIKFDSGFNLTTDSVLYCTELVYKLTNIASGEENYLPVSIINDTKYIAIDNLYLNAHSTLIYSQIY